VSLLCLMAKAVGHAVAGSAQHFIFLTCRRNGGRQQCTQRNTDRAQRQWLLIKQMIEAATCALALLAQAFRGMPAGIADTMSSIGQGSGYVMHHLTGSVTQVAARLFQAGSLGGKLVAQRWSSAAGWRRRLTILPCQQQKQTDAREYGRHRVGFGGVAKVGEELATAAFHVAQRGIDEFTG